MYVVVQEDKYGLDSGCYVGEVYGPFTTRQAAKAFADKCDELSMFAQSFSVHQLETALAIGDIVIDVEE